MTETLILDFIVKSDNTILCGYITKNNKYKVVEI